LGQSCHCCHFIFPWWTTPLYFHVDDVKTLKFVEAVKAINPATVRSEREAKVAERDKDDEAKAKARAESADWSSSLKLW
jgi:hypothetical protein